MPLDRTGAFWLDSLNWAQALPGGRVRGETQAPNSCWHSRMLEGLRGPTNSEFRVRRPGVSHRHQSAVWSWSIKVPFWAPGSSLWRKYRGLGPSPSPAAPGLSDIGPSLASVSSTVLICYLLSHGTVSGRGISLALNLQTCQTASVTYGLCVGLWPLRKSLGSWRS